MRDELIDVVSGALSVPRERLRPETRLDEVLRDSLDAVELIALLDERFGVDVDPAELAGITTLADVDAYVTQHQDRPRRRPAF